MFVPQSAACTVQNSSTPITPAQITASVAATAAMDAQANKLLSGWIGMLDRTPESFSDLYMPPSQFVQPQSAISILGLDRVGMTSSDRAAAYRAGPVCNPDEGGPLVLPLNQGQTSLPDPEQYSLTTPPMGPLPAGYGLSGYRRGAARRRVPARGMGCAGDSCHCGGKCGGHGMGDVPALSTGLVFVGAIAAALWVLAPLVKGR